MFWKKLQIQRVRCEDALRHIYDCAFQKKSATILSVAGALRLKNQTASTVVSQMEQQGLIQIKGDGLHLKPYGEARAIQIIRAHRLWECHLADNTGLPLDEIHRHADRKEHTMTSEEVDRLEARLGHPIRDPHGAPIPSKRQTVNQSQVTSLVDWPVEKLACILYIEDEPQKAFKQIIALGLMPGSYLKVLESTGRGLRLLANTQECWINPLAAANILVEEAPIEMEKISGEPLCALKVGEVGKILFLREQGASRRRFLDLGLVPGTHIKVAMPSALKEPMAYIVRDTMIALRKEQAGNIFVERVTEETFVTDSAD